MATAVADSKEGGVATMKRITILLIAGFLGGCSESASEISDTTAVDGRIPDDKVHRVTEQREMPKDPLPEDWQYANERQRERAKRSFVQLKKRNVPVYDGPLFVDDDEEARLRTPQEVARRTLVLWAVELRAEGVPQQEALGLIEQLDLWSSASPEEKRLLHDADPDPDECQRLVWRLESIWVLLWALRYVEELEWPGGMCDVPKIVEILESRESSPDFIIGARLRSKAELLDAQDLTMRIHWAVRDAHLHQGGLIPENLDWSQDHDMVPVGSSAAVGVVEQWHQTLNWLLNYPEQEDWDNVDTPT